MLLSPKSRRERDLPDWTVDVRFRYHMLMLLDATLISMGPKRIEMPEDCITLGQHPDVDCIYRTSDGPDTRDQDTSKHQAPSAASG